MVGDKWLALTQSANEIPDVLVEFLTTLKDNENRPLSILLGALGSSPAAILPQINPVVAIRFERRISELAGWYWHRPISRVRSLFGGPPSPRSLSKHVPEMAVLLLAHPDGRVREDMLKQIRGPLQSAFAVAAIAWRLNDWSLQVRRAAQKCVSICFPQTDASLLAAALFPLIIRFESWGRWERSLRDDILAMMLERSDVVSETIDQIVQTCGGPIPSILNRLCESPVFDPYLPRIANEAANPDARAIALRCLIDRKVQIANGKRWRWIDKSMGLRRQERAFVSRDVLTQTDRIELCAIGAVDRACVVRRTAMEGLIRHDLDNPRARAIALNLSGDRSRSVKAKASFIIAHHAALKMSGVD